MKKIIFVLMLGLSLTILSACTFNLTKPTKTQTQPVLKSLSDGNYVVSTSTSKIAWEASKVSSAPHTGTIAIKSGTFTISGKKLTGGNLTLNTQGITNDQNIDALVKHLNSKDFFDTATYPEANLIISSVSDSLDGNSFDVTANLTIKGKTAPVNFKINLLPRDNKVIVTSNLQIDRTIWGIKYGSGKFFQNLGDNMIKDDITLAISLEATK